MPIDAVRCLCERTGIVRIPTNCSEAGMPDPKFVAASAVALTVTLVAIFSLRPLAPRLGLVDRPHGRKCHRGRVPLIGGLCFFLGTLAGLVYLGYLDDFVVSLLVISTLILLTGLVDDLRDMSVRSRLTIQACAAGLGHCLHRRLCRQHRRDFWKRATPARAGHSLHHHRSRRVDECFQHARWHRWPRRKPGHSQHSGHHGVHAKQLFSLSAW